MCVHLGLLHSRWILYHLSLQGSPYISMAFPVTLVVKDLPASAGDVRDAGSIARSGRSPGHPLQYSCLENPMDRGA